MRNSILIEVKDIALADFTNKLPLPDLIEDMPGGIRIFFNDIEEVAAFQQQIAVEEAPLEVANPENKIKEKINAELIKAIADNCVILESVKAYAKALFQFIFKREGHRQDKLVILHDMLAEILKSSNSIELEQAIKAATFELGPLLLNHNLTFYFFAHNDVDYNFEKIKNQLLKELEIQKLKLGS
jgi:hypothetical protein